MIIRLHVIRGEFVKRITTRLTRGALDTQAFLCDPEDRQKLRNQLHNRLIYPIMDNYLNKFQIETIVQVTEIIGAN